MGVFSRRKQQLNFEKMKVSVTCVEDGHLVDLDLPQDALITDVKIALAEQEGYKDPINRLRVFYKNASGDALGKFSERKLSTFSRINMNF